MKKYFQLKINNNNNNNNNIFVYHNDKNLSKIVAVFDRYYVCRSFSWMTKRVDIVKRPFQRVKISLAERISRL